MGCDIHLIAEVKRGGKWHRVLPPASLQTERDKEAEEWYDDRNYDCFAVLANVRNGYACAGVKTGSGFIPISEPRGLPKNMSGVRDDIDNWFPDKAARAAYNALGDTEWEKMKEIPHFNLGDHSFSWLTLREILDYPHWDDQVTQTGAVAASHYAAMVASGRAVPDAHCGAAFGSRTRTISQADADRALAGGGIAIEEEGYTYVQVEWQATVKDQVGRFYTDVIPALAALDPEPSNVRIVFGFDS